VADIFRAQGKNFIDSQEDSVEAAEVMRAFMHCRTAAPGGHVAARDVVATDHFL
jgi:hypothetical protein